MNIVLKIIIVIISSIFLLNIQLWIVNKIFPQKEEQKKVLRYTLLMGFIVASSLLVFTYVVQPRIGDTYQTDPVGYSTYIACIGGIIALLFAAKKQRWMTFISSTLTILSIATGVSEFIFTGTGIGLIILKATGEEVLKTASSQSLSSHGVLYKSDIIIFSVLAGLGFALFENIIYFVAAGSVGQFLVRSITLSVLHGIFTGTIGYILWRYAKISFFGYIIAYIFGVSIHSLYNISLTTIPIVGGIGFTIGGYFLLSYLLYKSDRLYNNR